MFFCCVISSLFWPPCQKGRNTDEKNIWPHLPPLSRGPSLRFRSQAHIIFLFELFLKWGAQVGFPFILLYYFQIKLGLMLCVRTTKAKLQGVSVTSHSVVWNSWAPHLRREGDEPGGSWDKILVEVQERNACYCKCMVVFPMYNRTKSSFIRFHSLDPS